MSKVKQTEEKMAREVAAVQAMLAVAEKENRDLNDDEKKEVDETTARIDALRLDKERFQRIENLASEILNTNRINPRQLSGRPDISDLVSRQRHRALACIKNQEDAYKSGKFLQAVLSTNPEVRAQARQFCVEHGLIMDAHSSNVNTDGGYLVPELFEMPIVNLKEQFGVLRRNSRVYPMSGPVDNAPRRLSGVTRYYVAQNTEITESQATFGQVRLDAKDVAILTLLSNQLNSDSVISMADFVAEDMAYQFAYGEDNDGFNGDGGSTYGGITGFKNALNAGSLVTATATQNTFAELTMGFFTSAIGALPQYPGLMPKWYVSSNFYSTAMLRLQAAAGGNTIMTLSEGASRPKFLGYDVEFTQVLPAGDTTDYASTVVGFFGDLRLAATLGDLRGISIASDSSGEFFKKNQTAIRGIGRWDYVVHERGTASAAGPVIGLKMGTA